jgi:alpha,alpha-trehalase
VTVEKIVALYTSRDPGISESGQDARLAVARAADFAELLSGHQRAWQRAWNRCDIEMDSANEWTATVLHLHTFHLLQPSLRAAPIWMSECPREVARGGVPGSYLLGRAVHFPVHQLSASLARRRPCRLPLRPTRAQLERRQSTKLRRCPCFPGKAAPTDGKRLSGWHLNPASGRWLPDRSHRQRHVNIAIAYNVWQHYMVTESLEFLRFTGR